MSKTKRKESINSLKIGEKDTNGHIIVDILASGNEYSIYEIETKDINKKLRVLIDGNDDKSEKILTDKFNNVKQKYIEAKGLLYKSQNFGIMKNRVAHALSTALSSDTVNSNEEFISLINDIKNEAKLALKNRIFYLLPSTILVVLMFIYLININSYLNYELLIFGASLGGSLSVLFTLKKRNFEEFDTFHYFIIGLERIFLANIATAIIFILIKSGLFLPSFTNYNLWITISIGVIAGFSEQLAPSLLNKIQQNKE